MATLKINGDTSGYVELVSPAIAGSTSIELDKILVADSSGNIDVTGQIVSDKLFVDGNTIYADSGTNRVGINKTSPATTLDVGGSIFFSSILRSTTGGTESSPSIQPGLDGDTGMFWPAVNNIGFSTAGTERIRINASGNVGIGDTDPSSRLTVSKNSTRTTDVENMVKIDHTSSGTTGVGFGSAIYFLGERENGVTQAMGRLIYQAEVNSGTDISSGFVVQTATAGASSDKLRVTHDGHVGIGETSTAKLGNSLGTLLNVNNANIIGNGTSGSYLTYNARYNSTWLRQETSGVGILSFTNAGNLTYRTAVSGNAGTEPSLTEIIRTGDADPAYVTFDGASQVRLTLGNEGSPGTNTANWIRGNAGYLQYNSASNAHTWEVGGTERMRLSPSGHVITPYQPAFDAAMPASSSASANLTGWQYTYVNRGNHFNASTGKFTAPVAGTYVFYGTGIKSGTTTTTARYYLVKNSASGWVADSRHLRLDGGQVNTYGDNGTMQWMVDLAENDWVQARINGGTIYAATPEYTIFGGYLLG